MTRAALRAALEAGAVANGAVAHGAVANGAVANGAVANGGVALWSGDSATWRNLAASARGAVRRYIGDIDIAAAGFKVESIPNLSFTLYRRFDTDGDRLSFEDAYFSRRRRLAAFALRYLLRRETADLAALEDILWAIADEYSWALPSHLGGRSLTASGHETAIDLFAGETAFAFAEILHLVGGDLLPVVAERARSEVFRRVLDPFQAGAVRYAWEDMRNNWAAVCASSVGSAALYLIGDAERQAAILERLWPCFNRFIDSFADDGACLEGIGYWTYGFGFFVSFAELLRHRTAGVVDLLESDTKIERIAHFQQRAYLNDHCAVSFADGSAEEPFHPGLARFLMRRFAGVRRPPTAMTAGFFDDPCARWCLVARDLAWSDDKALSDRDDPVEAYHYFTDAQWLVRPAAKDVGLAFAAKGGHNGEPHNHNDVGSFMLAAGDDIFLVDLGAGEYTKDYFGDRRYDIFGPSSLSHNVPIVDGRGQGAGAVFCATGVGLVLSGDRLDFEMDIAGAYDTAQFPNGRVTSLRRRFQAAASGPLDRLFLADEFGVEPVGLPLRERFVTSFCPEIDADGPAVRLRGKSGTLRIMAEGPLDRPEITVHTHRTHDGRNLAVYAIDYPVHSVDTSIRCEFVFSYEPAG